MRPATRDRYYIDSAVSNCVVDHLMAAVLTKNVRDHLISLILL